MFNVDANQILLLAFWVLLLGVGTYVTYVHQERTLDTLEESVTAKKEEMQEVERLQGEREDLEATLNTLRDRWKRTYKVVPQTRSSADVVAYLTALTRTGFKTFNVESRGRTEGSGYDTYTFGVEGKAYFTSLYRLVWRMENSRSFYRIQNLELDYLEERTTDEEEGRTTMDVLVSFDMDVEAIHGILPGGGEGGGERVERLTEIQRAQATADRSASLPTDVLPEPVPDINPFYPLIFDEVPPNEDGDLNVETAQFISIVDGQAVFETREGVRRLREGDAVYLGRIVEINSSKGLLRARLNRGGIIDDVERHLNPKSPLQQVDETNSTP